MFPQKHKTFSAPYARIHYIVVLCAFLLFSVLAFFSLINTANPRQAVAATSSTLTFQGRLYNADGSVVDDGYYNIEFKIFNASTSAGSSQGSCAGDANCVWVETYYDSNGVTAGNDNRLRVVNGYFSANLGSLSAFGAINWDQEHWISMNIGGPAQTATPTYDGEMTPRIKLTAVPYAFRAGAILDGSGNAYDADDFVQLSPGSVQGVNSANTAIRVNQTGAGNILQLQSSSTDRFVIENDGDVVSSADGTFQGGSLTVGTASVGGDLVLYDGSSNTATITLAAFGQNSVITIPDPGSGSDTVCLQALANCAGSGDIVQDGNSFGTAVTIGSNDAYGVNIETNGTTTFSLSNTGAALFKNSTNSTTAFQIQNVLGTQIFNVDNSVSNLLTNPSVEQSISGNWTAKGASTVTQDSTQKYIGGYSAKVVTTAVASDGIEQSYTFSNVSYNLTFYAKLDGGSAAFATMQAGYKIGAGADTSCLTAQTVTTSGWTRFSCTFTPSAGAGSVYIKQTDATAHTFYVDAVQLVASSVSNPYREGNIALNGVVNSPTVFQNQTDSSTGFQIQNAAGTSNLFVVDTAGSRIGIGKVPTTGTLDVNGIVAASQYYTQNGIVFTTTGVSAVSKQVTAGTTGFAQYDVVVFDSTASGTDKVITTTTARDNRVFGVATAAAGSGGSTYVAVSGTYTINVDTGAVAVGDQLVTSTTSGRATVDNNATTGIIGIAISSKAGGSNGTVVLSIRPVGGQYSPIYRNASDSTTAFQIQASAGTNIFTVDSTNQTIAVGTATPGTTAKLRIDTSSYTNLLLNATGAGNNILELQKSGTNVVTVANAGATTFRNQADSTTAFQIQNAGGVNELFSVDTTNSRVYIGDTTGDTTGALLILDTKTDGTDPTGINGGMYYNSSLNKFRCYENGSWVDCVNSTATATLQNAYDAGSAGDQVIALDSTQDSIIFRNPSSGGTNGTGYVLSIDQLATDATGGLDIQSAGTGNLLRVRDTTATARDVLTIADGGAATFRNQTDSSGAFVIQNAAGATILNTNTTAGRISIGTNGTDTGQLYVGGQLPSAATGSVSLGASQGPINVFSQGRYLYVTDFDGNNFKIVDVSDPASPVVISTRTTGTNPVGIYVAGDYAYVANRGSDTLTIYNVSNPSSVPAAVGSIATDDQPYDVFVSGRYAYVVNDNTGSSTLRVYDVTNPAAPTQSGTLTLTSATARSVYVQGRYAYVVTQPGIGQLEVVDISNPASPASVSTSNVGAIPYKIMVKGRYAYVSKLSGSPGIEIYDVSDPTSPTLTDSIATDSAIDFDIQGRYLYITNFNDDTLEIIDVADPTNISSVGTVGTGTNPRSVTLLGRYAYVANYGSNSIQSFDVGGSYIQQLEAGGIETGTLYTSGNASFGNDVNINGGLNVSGNTLLNGRLGVNGSVLFQNAVDSTTAFQVQDANGASVLNVETTGTNHEVSIGSGSSFAGLAINGGAGNARDLYYRTGGLDRFILRVTSAAESGSNAGSNFEIINRDDAGAYLGTPLAINRASGSVTLRNTTNSASGLSILQADGSTRLAVDTQDGGGLLIYGNTSDKLFEISSNAGLQVSSTATAAWSNLGTTSGVNILNLYNASDVLVGSVSESGAVLFQNSTNSTNALRVQNLSGNNVLSVSTASATNALVTVGGALANSELMYVSNGNNRFSAGVDSSGLGGSDSYYIYNYQGTPGYVFGIGATNGNAIFRNTVNSTTAFQIQNVAGTNNVFTADTTNSRIGINTSSASYDLSFGGDSARTIGLQTRSTNAAGSNFTISAGAAGSGASAFSGGVLALQGGAAGGTGNANGGAVTIAGGAGVGTGTQGLVNLSTSAFSSASVQTFASSASLTAGNVDNYSSLPVLTTASSVVVTVPDPAQTTIGRLLYISARDNSIDFTLRLNSARTPIDITMKENSTATLIWNGTDWTAAGASSSTDLQAAYNNTIASAGGAELVLNAPGGNADGLTVRNNATTPITGGLLEVQTSIGSNLFTVNNNATEYATNGGAETAGASASTFPSNTWDTTTGGTVDRWTTAGDNIATGQASVRVQTTTTNHGARNRISTSLTSGLTYKVSFAVRGAANFSTLQVLYSPDGTTSGTTTCITGNVVTEGIWTRVSCSFIASGTITSSNSILIRQTDATARTFYIDNLSINVNASATYAADGSVDSALGTNWTAFGTLDALTRDTSVIYDTSGSVNVDTPNNADRGVRNNLAVTPATSTQYLVTFYARSSNTFNDIRVRYTRDGGTNFVSCVDYNTQTVSTTAFTEITCLFTTDSTTATNPDLVIDQPTGSNRNFYIDALSVTLNTNNSNNVQIGGGNRGGPVTLFTLDRSDGAPIASNNDAYLGSMYYDTTTGRIQCYEADGWGACGAAPDNYVNLNPEYAGAVLNGTANGASAGVGTMTADLCSNETGVLEVNTSLCSAGESRNYYRWTSPQASQQTYSIYVSYQLPETFNGFSSDDTVQLVARADSTSNAAVTYEMFKSTGSALSKCGSGETTVVTSANTWQSVGINGNESTGCALTSSSAGDFIIFKINLKANSNANAYVSTLSFTTTGR